MSGDLAWLSLAEAGERIRRRELSPVELTRALIDRIERLDGQLNAFLRPTPEAALAEARAAEAEIMAGGWRGPLHGVSYALKDIIDYQGLPTTAHSKVLADNIARDDAFVTARLRQAGGVHLGKLSTHEFAIGGPSFDLPWPPARNPWNREHFPGGSSSGSGAGLAAGFFAAALGTDTGGSVRNPASMCGITGLKPTYGRTSRRGVVPLAQSLDHVGPMTRTVRDNALLLQIVAGHDRHDPGSADEPVDDYLAALEAGVRGLRIGVVRHFYTEDMAADPEQAAAIEAALAVWRQAGAEIVELRLPALAEWNAPTRVIIAAEAYAVHERWLKERPQDYGARGRERLLQGALLRASDYIQAQRRRTQLIRVLAEARHGVEALVTVSSLDPAPRLDDDAELARRYERQARMPFNLSGNPALVIPAGFTRDGHLPLSLQLVGHPFEEAMLYRIAQVYESATGWVDRHPPLDG
jgi:aspartyl-tRNA(Asn)/glutamyl-tRNA(Gln) amidotransferase subunit A